ncbi:MAG: hypothetical protein RR396_00075, partial [Clostridiales bacterium]
GLGNSIQISNNTARKLFLNGNAVCYMADGYNPGLFELAGSQEKCLYKGNVELFSPTKEGIVYQVKGDNGIYLYK